MRDFNLYLPEGSGITKLAIVPKFDDMHPLIQRAVCLLVMHEDVGLNVSGIPVMSFVQQATNNDLVSVAQMLSVPADRLLTLLNVDGITAKSVEFLVANNSGTLSVTINITPAGSDEPTSATIYSM